MGCAAWRDEPLAKGAILCLGSRTDAQPETSPRFHGALRSPTPRPDRPREPRPYTRCVPWYLQAMQTFHGFDRITSDPKILCGKPCIRGMRISVQRVLEILAQNPSWDAVRNDYPALEEQDLRQALAFAAAFLTDTVIPLDTSAA